MIGFLLILNLLICGYIVLLQNGKTNVVKLATFIPMLFLAIYILVSGCFFAFDCFDFNYVLCSCTVVELIVSVYFKIGKKRTMREVELSSKNYIVPLTLALIAFLMSIDSFGYFGMGQDQGVYQVKAIDLLYGSTNREYVFPEYDLLETEEERELFHSKTRGQAGLDNMKETETEVLALPRLLNPDAKRTENDAAGIFHGIPTFPAVLALWAKVVGLEHMANIEAVFHALCVLLIWFIAENLSLKTPAKVLACCVYLFSPEALWVAKSTLTEGFFAVIIAAFLYLLLQKEHPENRWYSAFVVLVFSLWHVSIYAMIPMFIVLYCFMYMWTEERQYIRASVFSAISFAVGFTMMVIVSPKYTIKNTARMWFGPLNENTVFPFFMLVAVVAIILTLVLSKIKTKRFVEKLIQSGFMAWLFRGLLAASFLLVAYQVVKCIPSSGGLIEAVTINGIYNMVWVTGIFFLPVTVIAAMINPKQFFDDERNFALAFVFFYSVIIMLTVLKPVIEYCYYYGRYLVPYIPVVSIAAAVVWNQFSAKLAYGCTALSCLFMLPFNSVLLTQKDDTVFEYDVIAELSEKIYSDNTAVVFIPSNIRPLEFEKKLFLPIREMAGVHCYYMADDFNGQLAWLNEQYDHIYAIDAVYENGYTELDGFFIVDRIFDQMYLDDNSSKRPILCPLPIGFTVNKDITISLFKQAEYKDAYEYRIERVSPIIQELDGMSSGVGRFKRGKIVSQGRRGHVMYGPYISLEAGCYQLDIHGHVSRGEFNDDSVFDIACDAGTKVLYVQKNLSQFVSDGEFVISISLELEESVDNIEFRLFINEGIYMEIDDLQLKAIATQQETKQ